jgi:hypothetical protein
MRLTPPAKATWIVALLIGLIGILAHEGVFRIPGLAIAPFWIVTVAFVLLLIAPLVKGI